MHKLFSLIIAFMLLLFLSSCKPHSNAKSSHIHIVRAAVTTDINHLYYNGVIQPLHTANIYSPADGVVQTLYVQYGDWVQAKQKILVIRSTESQKIYASALTDYITKKDQYYRNQTNFEATNALYKAGIVAKETYTSEQSQLETSKLAYLAAATTLQNLQRNFPDSPQNLTTLTLENAQQLETTLQKPFNDFVVTAPISGILLAPQKNPSQSNNSSSDKLLMAGEEIKENQLLFNLGDMSGISTTINVSETDINQIIPGQAALLTSWALPGLVLHGTVTNVARQALANSGQNAASFPVQIIIPTINDAQRALVRIGMTAKVDIEIQHAPHIKIPISAVSEKNGHNIVTVVDPNTGAKREVIVSTGTTDLTEVVIVSGLKTGDNIVVPND